MGIRALSPAAQETINKLVKRSKGVESTEAPVISLKMKGLLRMAMESVIKQNKSERKRLFAKEPTLEELFAKLTIEDWYAIFETFFAEEINREQDVKERMKAAGLTEALLNKQGYELLRRNDVDGWNALREEYPAPAWKPDISKKNFSDCCLAEANFERVKAVGATFRGADLMGANLKEMQAKNANFSGTDMRHAQINLATFIGANFRVANLMGVDVPDFLVLYETDIHGCRMTPELHDFIQRKHEQGAKIKNKANVTTIAKRLNRLPWPDAWQTDNEADKTNLELQFKLRTLDDIHKSTRRGHIRAGRYNEALKMKRLNHWTPQYAEFIVGWTQHDIKSAKKRR